MTNSVSSNKKQNDQSDAKTSRQEKDEASEDDIRKVNTYMVMGIVLIIVAAGIISFMLLQGGGQVNNNTNLEGNILIPISEIGTTASYYNQNIDGVNIKYFSLRGSDGQIHTAFDACDVCFQDKKGYEQQGDDMVCRNCGNRYPSNGIGTENIGGGCWPGYLEITIDGDNIVITKTNLAKGKYYFE